MANMRALTRYLLRLLLGSTVLLQGCGFKEFSPQQQEPLRLRLSTVKAAASMESLTTTTTMATSAESTTMPAASTKSSTTTTTASAELTATMTAANTESTTIHECISDATGRTRVTKKCLCGGRDNTVFITCFAHQYCHSDLRCRETAACEDSTGVTKLLEGDSCLCGLSYNFCTTNHYCHSDGSCKYQISCNNQDGQNPVGESCLCGRHFHTCSATQYCHLDGTCKSTGVCASQNGLSPEEKPCVCGDEYNACESLEYCYADSACRGAPHCNDRSAMNRTKDECYCGGSHQETCRIDQYCYDDGRCREELPCTDNTGKIKVGACYCHGETCSTNKPFCGGDQCYIGTFCKSKTGMVEESIPCRCGRSMCSAHQYCHGTTCQDLPTCDNSGKKKIETACFCKAYNKKSKCAPQEYCYSNGLCANLPACDDHTGFTQLRGACGCKQGERISICHVAQYCNYLRSSCNNRARHAGQTWDNREVLELVAGWRLKEIRLWSHERSWGIQFVKEYLSGEVSYTEVVGSKYSNAQTLQLGPTEYITEVRGNRRKGSISFIEFLTNTDRSVGAGKLSDPGSSPFRYRGLGYANETFFISLHYINRRSTARGLYAWFEHPCASDVTCNNSDRKCTCAVTYDCNAPTKFCTNGHISTINSTNQLAYREAALDGKVLCVEGALDGYNSTFGEIEPIRGKHVVACAKDSWCNPFGTMNIPSGGVEPSNICVLPYAKMRRDIAANDTMKLCFAGFGVCTCDEGTYCDEDANDLDSACKTKGKTSN
eukprot:GEMP01012004.1.p1 GENE.GEMP01012004.1~~GEMP01012004.1.p1  ORF type:complete len:773 (+),score=102.42 GEMP01012004.1:237-2555(+)